MYFFNFTNTFICRVKSDYKIQSIYSVLKLWKTYVLGTKTLFWEEYVSCGNIHELGFRCSRETHSLHAAATKSVVFKFLYRTRESYMISTHRREVVEPGTIWLRFEYRKSLSFKRNKTNGNRGLIKYISHCLNTFVFNFKPKNKIFISFARKSFALD